MKKLIGLFIVLLVPLQCSASSYTPSKDRIVDFITSTAMNDGVDVTTALAIATAESNLNPNAKNASSTASSLWQWLDGSFKYYCIDKYKIADSMIEKNDYHTATLCAIKVIADGGIDNWQASRVLWEKLLADG